MKLSTRSTYGLRAMLVLALEYGRGPIMVRKIAESQNLPVTYLEQILLPLRRLGLVNAIRGASGGYVLARPPEAMTLLEVIEVLEGPIHLVDCEKIAKCTWEPNRCALKDTLSEAAGLLSGFFSKRTLLDLVQLHRRLEGDLDKDTHETKV